MIEEETTGTLEGRGDVDLNKDAGANLSVLNIIAGLSLIRLIVQVDKRPRRNAGK